MSNNSTKNPESPETLGNSSNVSRESSPKVSGNKEISRGNVTEKVVTKGNVSEIVRSESPKVSEKPVAESPKVSEKPVAETPKRKRNQSPKQLANLKKGNVKIDKSKTLEPESAPEKIPAFNMNLPVKALIIMAFVVGATIGGFGLYKWWKDSKKKKQEAEINYTDIPEEAFEGISNEDLLKVYNDQQVNSEPQQIE